ncbi:MAG TPA: RidA family protein [Blastocatellia bacterium]|nr:RidA family protein [Blastocatellia bacterium]
MSRRRSIEIPGLQHENPIPVAAQIGPFLATSGVFGKDPNTGTIPPDIETQCALMFANLRLILTAAGGTPEDIIQMTVWVKDKALRPHVNREWLAMFPDEHSRPARHSLVNTDLPGAALVQCEMLAIINESES